MRNGDLSVFNSPIRDPITNQPFTGNQVCRHADEPGGVQDHVTIHPSSEYRRCQEPVGQLHHAAYRIQ